MKREMRGATGVQGCLFINQGAPEGAWEPQQRSKLYY